MRIGNDPFVRSSTKNANFELLPTKDYWGTVWYRGAISTTIQKSALESGQPPVTMRVIITYSDEFGSSYTEEICEQTLIGGAIANCQGKN